MNSNDILISETKKEAVGPLCVAGKPLLIHIYLIRIRGKCLGTEKVYFKPSESDLNALVAVKSEFAMDYKR